MTRYFFPLSKDDDGDMQLVENHPDKLVPLVSDDRDAGMEKAADLSKKMGEGITLFWADEDDLIAMLNTMGWFVVRRLNVDDMQGLTNPDDYEFCEQPLMRLQEYANDLGAQLWQSDAIRDAALDTDFTPEIFIDDYEDEGGDVLDEDD
jgi:hypothetical protein